MWQLVRIIYRLSRKHSRCVQAYVVKWISTSVELAEDWCVKRIQQIREILLRQTTVDK